MKYCLFLWLFLLVGMVRVQAAAGDVIRVSTAATDLIFRVGTDGRLYHIAGPIPMRAFAGPPFPLIFVGKV